MKNVLEIKTKKMSLANIDGRLTPAEMENIMAGSGCGWAIAGLVAGFAGAFVTTTPIGAGIFLVGFVSSSVGMSACR